MTTLLPLTRMIDAAWNGARETMDHPSATVTPRADVLEGDKEYHLMLDLPGVKTEDLEINLEGQTLTVKAQRRTEVPEDFKLRRQERAGDVTYSRSFNLGTEVDSDKIDARLEAGMLKITLAKNTQVLPRRIEVK